MRLLGPALKRTHSVQLTLVTSFFLPVVGPLCATVTFCNFDGLSMRALVLFPRSKGGALPG